MRVGNHSWGDIVNARLLLLGTLLAALPLFAACGGDDDDDDVGGNGDKITTLGSQPVNDHGTRDVKGMSSLELEADDFYFSPTFLRGEAGQKLTLKIENESATKHNISIRSASIDKDIEAKGSVEVEVTFPAEGVLLFGCKYHGTSGMVGELLVGNAHPQAPVASGSPGSSGPDYGY